MSDEEDLMGFITVTLTDQSYFKFAFRSTTTTSELLSQVCEKVGIKQPNFFGLKRLRNLRSNFDQDIIPKIWMSEKIPLFSQGCDSSTVLHVRHKYWFYDVEELTDPITLQLIFEETDRKLMTSRYENSSDTNMQLIACRVQIAYGDYNPSKPAITSENSKFMIPSYIEDAYSLEEWKRLVGVFHEKLKGQTKEQVQRKYLEIARDYSPNLQVTFFPAQYTTREMKKKVDILIGITPTGIGFYQDKKERRILQVFHRYKDLSSWVINPLWNGLEAPDYERPSSNDLKKETQQFITGPFRSQFFLKTKSKRTKDLELEVSSFVAEDDCLISFIDTYNKRLQQHSLLMSLDDQAIDHFVQVCTLDGTTKKIRVGSDVTGQDLILLFAEKIGLKDTAFFQLSSVADGSDRWIALTDSVLIQGITSSTVLTLKLRFFWKDINQITDPLSQKLYFLQCRECIKRGDIPVTENDAIELAALNFLYLLGTFDKKKKYDFYKGNLNDYIPFYLSEFHSFSWWEKKIKIAHEKLGDMKAEDVIIKYLRTASAMPNYGINYFSAIIPKTDEECMIGVSKLGLALFKNDNLELICSYRFGYELRGWTNDGEAIELKIKPSKNAEERLVTIVSLQFAEVIETLAYYEKMRKFVKHMSESKE